jgi:hypothetical protein
MKYLSAAAMGWLSPSRPLSMLLHMRIPGFSWAWIFIWEPLQLAPSQTCLHPPMGRVSLLCFGTEPGPPFGRSQAAEIANEFAETVGSRSAPIRTPPGFQFSYLNQFVAPDIPRGRGSMLKHSADSLRWRKADSNSWSPLHRRRLRDRPWRLAELRRFEHFEWSKCLRSLRWTPEGRHYSGVGGAGALAVILGGGWAGRSSFSLFSKRLSSGSGSV